MAQKYKRACLKMYFTMEEMKDYVKEVKGWDEQRILRQLKSKKSSRDSSTLNSPRKLSNKKSDIILRRQTTLGLGITSFTRPKHTEEELSTPPDFTEEIEENFLKKIFGNEIKGGDFLKIQNAVPDPTKRKESRGVQTEPLRGSVFSQTDFSLVGAEFDHIFKSREIFMEAVNQLQFKKLLRLDDHIGRIKSQIFKNIPDDHVRVNEISKRGIESLYKNYIGPKIKNILKDVEQKDGLKLLGFSKSGSQPLFYKGRTQTLQNFDNNDSLDNFKEKRNRDRENLHDLDEIAEARLNTQENTLSTVQNETGRDKVTDESLERENLIKEISHFATAGNQSLNSRLRQNSYAKTDRASLAVQSQDDLLAFGQEIKRSLTPRSGVEKIESQARLIKNFSIEREVMDIGRVRNFSIEMEEAKQGSLELDDSNEKRDKEENETFEEIFKGKIGGYNKESPSKDYKRKMSENFKNSFQKGNEKFFKRNFTSVERINESIENDEIDEPMPLIIDEKENKKNDTISNFSCSPQHELQIRTLPPPNDQINSEDDSSSEITEKYPDPSIRNFLQKENSLKKVSNTDPIPVFKRSISSPSINGKPRKLNLEPQSLPKIDHNKLVLPINQSQTLNLKEKKNFEVIEPITPITKSANVKKLRRAAHGTVININQAEQAKKKIQSKPQTKIFNFEKNDQKEYGKLQPIEEGFSPEKVIMQKNATEFLKLKTEEVQDPDLEEDLEEEEDEDFERDFPIENSQNSQESFHSLSPTPNHQLEIIVEREHNEESEDIIKSSKKLIFADVLSHISSLEDPSLHFNPNSHKNRLGAPERRVGTLRNLGASPRDDQKIIKLLEMLTYEMTRVKLLSESVKNIKKEIDSREARIDQLSERNNLLAKQQIDLEANWKNLEAKFGRYKQRHQKCSVNLKNEMIKNQVKNRKKKIQQKEKKKTNLKQMMKKLGKISKKSSQDSVGSALVKILSEGKFSKFKSKLTPTSVMRTISLLYSERSKKLKKDPESRSQKFCDFVYEYYLHHYGIFQGTNGGGKARFTSMILSVKALIQHFRVNLFARFLGLIPGYAYGYEEINIYIEALEFLSEYNENLGVKNKEEGLRVFYPYIRAEEYLKEKLENKMTADEYQEFRREVKSLVEERQTEEEAQTRSVLDFDFFIEKVMIKYKVLINRTKKYVVDAFKSCDLDGNNTCSVEEFRLLTYHIEPEKFDIHNPQKCVEFFFRNCDLEIDGERNMSFDQFAFVCTEEGLFSAAAQNEFLGCENEEEILEKLREIKKIWFDQLTLFRDMLDEFKSITDEERGSWTKIINVLDERIKAEKPEELKSTMIAYRITELELKRIKEEDENDLENYSDFDLSRFDGMSVFSMESKVIE